MKIKVMYKNTSSEISESMNNFMEEIITKGFMIIDFGIDNDEREFAVTSNIVINNS